MKKKLFAICLIVCLALVAVAGASLAYFTDTDEQVNTFTSGKVDITLDETVVTLNNDGYIDEDAIDTAERTSEDQFYGKLYPGQVIVKDPTITVDKESEKAYVAAKITVSATDLESLIGTGYEGLLGINSILSGGLVNPQDTMKTDHPLFGTLPVYGNEEYSIYQEKVADGVHVFYIFIENEMSGGDSVTLFEEIGIPTDWTAEDLAKIADLKISVKAFAVQTQTFDSCLDAMTAAFESEFDF